MNKILCTALLLLTLHANSQEGWQSFPSAGFKVKSPCHLRTNTLFREMAASQAKKPIAAYVCAQNEDDPETGSIVNINVYDESASYRDIAPSRHAYFDASYLDAYASQLAQNGIAYKRIRFQGLAAIEYSFDQMGLPTKAIVFLHNKHSYLLQIGTRHQLAQRFSQLKSNFLLL